MGEAPSYTTEEAKRAFERLEPDQQESEIAAAHTAGLADNANVQHHQRRIDRITGREQGPGQVETPSSITANHLRTLHDKIALADILGRQELADELRSELDKFHRFHLQDKEAARNALTDAILGRMDEVVSLGTANVDGVDRSTFEAMAEQLGATIELRATSPANPSERLVIRIVSPSLEMWFSPVDRRVSIYNSTKSL